MQAESYDVYEQSEAYDAFDGYSDKWRPPGRRQANYSSHAGAAGASKPTDTVTRTELQLALAPISRDMNANAAAVASLGKRVETAFVKIDKDLTAARRDMGGAKRAVQSSQMMALLPMLLNNNTPPQLTQTQTGLNIRFIDASNQIIDISTIRAEDLPTRLAGARPIIVNDRGDPVRVVTDVEYGAAAQQALGSNNNSMLLVMMMMMGGLGGASEGGKEFTGSSDNGMMMMMLVMMMMRPQNASIPQSQVIPVQH